MRMILFAIGVSLLFGLSGCGEPTEDRIENVVAVYMHEVDHYSVAVADSNSASSRVEIAYLSGQYNSRGRVKIFRDVPAGKMMWVRRVRLNDMDSHVELEIHIHSTADIQGGGWNHGKFGSGQTVVIDK